MTDLNLSIRFLNVDSAQADQWAGNLKNVLLDQHPQVSIKQVSDNPEAMMIGAELSVILGSGAVVAIAKGIQHWLKSHQSASIEIRKDGTVKASGLTGKQTIDLVALLQKNKEEKPPGISGK